ncbi:MAG: SDR family oxidoreductase, partial [Desulfobacteraceae bacterium]
QIRQTLLSIVSELTGYPEQMLGLEMDIESDLGIDSIKRVEILSAVEEKFPHLPQVTPDMMGTLKTLGQICDFLTGPADAATQPADSTARTVPCPESSEAPQIRQTLLSIVSELTGYPEQMLGLEMDIESDLGIDSIKRVEILSAVEEKLPHLPQVTPDMMGTLKTLGQICEFLAKGRAGGIAINEKNEIASNDDKNDQAPHSDEAGRILSRKLIRVKEMPRQTGTRWTLPKDGFVAVAGSNDAMNTALIQALAGNDIVAKFVATPEELSGQKGATGLILVAPMAAGQALEWAKLASAFERRTDHNGACFCSITFLDGAFGFNNLPLTDPVQGALAGLVKTAAIEWPSVRCLALDIDPEWTQLDAVANQIALEVAYPQDDDVVEIGLSADRRIGLELVRSPLTRTAQIDLSPDDVVVVTGGARGVTGSAVQALAARCGCKLALLGRSQASENEPDWLEGLSKPGEMKAAILEHYFSDRNPTPIQVEAAYQSFISARQINDAIGLLSDRGLTVRYYSVDVRDYQKIAQTFDLIREELGQIKGIIHGAGVLADRLIAEKQPEQFEQVFETKVDGLHALLDASESDALRYLVLFSSVSARVGNRGQADYAMANEALNKIARQQAKRLPNCKVLSINWGPFDGGMVTPSLKAAFEARGIGLIAPMDGAEAMVDEMANPVSDAIEVVIGSLFDSSRISAPVDADADKESSSEPQEMSITAKRLIDIDHHPVLRSHQLDGRPVVPLALMTEWLAHSALHANPGLSLHGLDRLRLLNGIVLDGQKASVCIMAGKARRVQDQYEVDVEIRDDSRQNSDLVHSSAKAILVERHPEAPGFNRLDAMDDRSADRSLEQVYEQILFHGKALRGLQHFSHLSELEMAARIAPAPPPADWMDKPLRSRWIMDPLVIDSAFQMAIVWCHNRLGKVSLPSYAQSYRQYRDRFPQNGVSALMLVKKHTKHKIICDFTFLDEERQVVATLKGYQAVMTPTLMRAFKAA